MQHRIFPRKSRPVTASAWSNDGLGQSDLFTNRTLWQVASVTSACLSAYHGYRRNDSIGWGIWWGICGGICIGIVPGLAFAQGFGEPAKD